MAKKFEKMETAVLEALLEDVNTSDADALKIESILDERERMLEDNDVVLNDEENANYDDAQLDEYLSEGDDLETEVLAEAKKAEEEAERREAIVEEMQAKVGNKAEVVPFNTIEWVEGYVSGILDDKRAKNPLWVVRSDEGKTIRKAYGSELIKVSDEKHPNAVIRRRGGTRASKPKYTEAQIQEILLRMQANIGMMFDHPRWGESTVIGVTHDKRHDTLMYAARSTDDDKRFNVVQHAVTEFIGENAEVREQNATRIEYAEEVLADPNAALRFKEAEVEALEEQAKRLQERLDAAKAAVADFEVV